MGCSCSSQGTAAQASQPKQPTKGNGQEPHAARLPEGATGAPSPPSQGPADDAATATPDASPPDASPATPAIGAAVRGVSAPELQSGAMSPPADPPKRRERPAATVPSSIFIGVNHNGFKTIPELLPFSCTEANLAPYSLPAESLNYEPPEGAVVTRFKNGDAERKIHCNRELSAPEAECLQALRQRAKSEGVSFFPSITSMATRFISRSRNDARKALTLMQATQSWREEYFKAGPLKDTDILEDMKHGIVYFSGRDECMRPAIIIRARRIPNQWYKDKCIDRFIKMLTWCMEYFLRYMVVPGKVENLSVIVDLDGLGIAQVPLGPLREVYTVMSHHYIGRVFKFFVVNMSSGLSFIASMAKAILSDRQKQKLNMLDDITELRKEFALTQLEVDLGGNREIFTQFLPFPLVPGPYTPGFEGPPDPDAMREAHKALTQAGAMGRLWDPKLSANDNKKLEFSHEAVPILERLNLPVPSELRFDEVLDTNAGEPQPAFSPPPAGGAPNLVEFEDEQCYQKGSDDEIIPQTVDNETVQAGSTSFFCCGPPVKA